MTNLLQQAINCDDADRAARIIQNALGIESDDDCFPKDWPADRERRAAVIGEWLKTEARYLGSRRRHMRALSDLPTSRLTSSC